MNCLEKVLGHWNLKYLRFLSKTENSPKPDNDKYKAGLDIFEILQSTRTQKHTFYYCIEIVKFHDQTDFL